MIQTEILVLDSIFRIHVSIPNFKTNVFGCHTKLSQHTVPNTHACFVRYSSPIELHLRPNVSTDRPVVFIRGDLTLQRYTLYTCGVTSVAKKLEEGGGCLSMSI